MKESKRYPPALVKSLFQELREVTLELGSVDVTQHEVRISDALRIVRLDHTGTDKPTVGGKHEFVTLVCSVTPYLMLASSPDRVSVQEYSKDYPWLSRYFGGADLRKCKPHSLLQSLSALGRKSRSQYEALVLSAFLDLEADSVANLLRVSQREASAWLSSAIEFLAAEITDSSSKRRPGALDYDIAVIWDPESITPDEYAQIVASLGNLARAKGALGVRRVLTEYAEASVGCGAKV